MEHTRTSLWARWGGTAAFFAALVPLMGCFAGWGHEPPSSAAAGVATVAVLLVNGGLIALGYLLAAFGYGRFVTRALLGRQSPTTGRHWVQCVLGIALMLWISHLLGLLGALSGQRGQWVGWGVVVLGLAALGWQVIRGSLRPETWSVWPSWAFLAAPGIALLLVAASSPPNALWVGPEAEGGGFDVLSYHLQLPKEWVVSAADGGVGRLWPVEHNVYSYLPSYMEGAYLHLAAMTGGGAEGGGNFVSGTGFGLMACQYLHAGMGIVAGLVLGRVVACVGRRAFRRFPVRDGEESEGGVDGVTRVSSILAFAVAVSVPWVMVVGSLAYNELAVLAMGAGAVLVALDDGLSSRSRGLVAGVLAGIACSAKMTAVLSVVPMAGALLLFAARTPWRARAGMTLAAIVGGAAAMLPWLVRNAVACGNPVFPFARGLFGNSHWTDEQFRRFAMAHASPGHGVMDHLTLLFSHDRGILHEQWSVLFPLGLAAILLVIGMTETRRLGALLLASLLLQLLTWMAFTHEQSRFLVPSMVPLCLGIGLGGVALLEWTRRRSDRTSRPVVRVLGSLVLALAPVSLASWGAQIFLTQRGGHPNLLLVAGVEAITGHAYAREIAELSDAMRARQLKDVATPAMYVNYGFDHGDAFYLLGQSTPLFVSPPDGQAALWYNTTWDASPLGVAVRADPGDPAAWSDSVTRAMRARLEARGRLLSTVYVLVDFNEISRLYPSDQRRQVWFDPALTQAVIRSWLANEATQVHAWPAGEGLGVYLYRLSDKASDQRGGTR